MLKLVTTPHGGTYHYAGDEKEGAKEYERFQGCLAQLIDSESLVGNLEGRWVIFQSGWVHGFCSYPSEREAIVFARQIFRDEPDASYIVAQVDPEKHALTAMHLLASALSDLDSLEIRAQRESEESTES